MQRMRCFWDELQGAVGRQMFRCAAAPALRCRVAEAHVSSCGGRKQRPELARMGTRVESNLSNARIRMRERLLGLGCYDGGCREDVAVVATGWWQNPGLYQEKGHLHTSESWGVQEAYGDSENRTKSVALLY